MTPVIYPYASGDLLEDRHTYFYSEYAGRPFLDSWRTQRGGLLEKLPKANTTGTAQGPANQFPFIA